MLAPQFAELSQRMRTLGSSFGPFLAENMSMSSACVQDDANNVTARAGSRIENRWPRIMTSCLAGVFGVFLEQPDGHSLADNHVGARDWVVHRGADVPFR